MKKIVIILIFVLGFVSVSCDKDFEELNVDPNNPTELPAHLFLGNIVRNQQNIMYSTFNGGDMGLCWAQQWSKVEYNDEEKYKPRNTSMDAVWAGLYVSVLTKTVEMEKFADLEGNTNLKGIALILRANAFQTLTDLYGPIPYTEALNPNVIKPVYDSEQVVYDGIINTLTQATTLLNSGTGAVPASSDIVYAGDTSKWIKLANALKLRALLRVSKAPGSTTAAQIQALVDGGQLMTSNADDAELLYKAAQPDANPIYETIVFGQRSEYKMASTFVDRLNTLVDPRLAVYAQKNNANAYVGNLPGIKPPAAAAISSIGTLFLSPTLPGVIMSYSQQQLLLAEAANENFISGGLTAANTYYLGGITASITKYGLSATAYTSNPGLSFGNQVDGRQKIAEQAWIALYGQGFEAWTEWRRTGFPVLAPAAGAFEATIPTRLQYNSLESSLNGANYNAATSTLDNGDKITSHLWWN